MKVFKAFYVVWSFLVVVLAYVLPYTIFTYVRDLTLYLFWTALAVAHLIISYTYLRFGGGGGHE